MLQAVHRCKRRCWSQPSQETIVGRRTAGRVSVGAAPAIALSVSLTQSHTPANNACGALEVPLELNRGTKIDHPDPSPRVSPAQPTSQTEGALG